MKALLYTLILVRSRHVFSYKSLETYHHGLDFTTQGAAIALNQFFQRPDCNIKHREKELLSRRYEFLK